MGVQHKQYPLKTSWNTTRGQCWVRLSSQKHGVFVVPSWRWEFGRCNAFFDDVLSVLHSRFTRSKTFQSNTNQTSHRRTWRLWFAGKIKIHSLDKREVLPIPVCIRKIGVIFCTRKDRVNVYVLQCFIAHQQNFVSFLLLNNLTIHFKKCWYK